jgi:fluoroacetyl-CoA thioesterase
MESNRIGFLTEGMIFSDSKFIEETDLDTYWHIGQLGVMAPPILVAFIEQTIVNFLIQVQGPAFETICVETNIKYLKPAHINEKIHCNIHLKFIDEDKLFFDVAVLDDLHEEVSIGAQERQVI